MHRVAHPYDGGPAGCHRLGQRRQGLADPARAHPGDQGEAARLAVRVEGLDQREHVLGGDGRADLDGNGVADLPRELDVGAPGITGSLPYPQQVRGRVIGLPAACIRPGQGALVVQQQGLVAGVELHRAELVGIGPAGVHERDGPVDLVGQLLVALPGRAGRHEVLVPGVDLAQVGVPAAGEGAAHVQRGRRAVVGVEQAVRVRRAGRGGELEPVHRVTPVSGEFHSVPDLGGRRARLAELARHPADLHHRHAGRVGQDDSHLEQGAKFVPDGFGRRAGEGLRAVTALQQERLTAGHRGEPLLQLIALGREHQGRQAFQAAQHRVEASTIRPLRLLQRGRGHVTRLAGGVRCRPGQHAELGGDVGGLRDWVRILRPPTQQRPAVRVQVAPPPIRKRGLLTITAPTGRLITEPAPAGTERS